ncbi:hypothetical protein JL193_12295 [Polaribacter batillariae]|uniref:Uncharacterized protein n=1 Tax=Polaribacter batillariae TaxID=2808900 RepID=A0ABX7SRP0_9FLAO|nr:hypothetical protein [Polaribacter batillariae]QTD36902.1 hypothetical protein JL193_12295 [Polaribacter batillariae]
MSFIELHLGSHIISHGYDENNTEIVENISADEFSKKLVAVSRIKSLSEKYILTDYAHGRWIYWEYQEDFDEVKKLLNN